MFLNILQDTSDSGAEIKADAQSWADTHVLWGVTHSLKVPNVVGGLVWKLELDRDPTHPFSLSLTF